MDVPKKKAGYLDTELVTDVCGYGIYPDLPEIESAGKGEKQSNSGQLQVIITRDMPRTREARVQLVPGQEARDDQLQAPGGGPARVPGGAEGGPRPRPRPLPRPRH